MAKNDRVNTGGQTNKGKQQVNRKSKYMDYSVVVFFKLSSSVRYCTILWLELNSRKFEKFLFMKILVNLPIVPFCVCLASLLVSIELLNITPMITS